MRRISTIVASLLLGALPGIALAQAPPQIPVQGYLTDDAGAPIDGDRSIVFIVYDSDIGGSALFTETQTVGVEAGYFTAHLGDVTALDLAIFRDNSTLWVELVVDSEVLSPRLALATTPYAAYAEYAGNVDWGNVGGVPGEIADGDADTTYSAGTGLSLGGTTFSVDASATQSRVTGTCTPGNAIRAVAQDGAVTCEPSGSSYTAGAGLNLAGTTFSVDTATIQARVTGSCGAGAYVRSIAANGTVLCGTDNDTNTTYSAGAGLSLVGTTFSVDTTALQSRVTGTCGAGQAIDAIAGDGTVLCESIPQGDLTDIVAGDGIAVTNSGGPSPIVSIPTSGVSIREAYFPSDRIWMQQTIAAGATTHYAVDSTYEIQDTIADCVVVATFGLDQVDAADPRDGIMLYIAARRRDSAGVETDVLIGTTNHYGIVDGADAALTGGKMLLGTTSTFFRPGPTNDYSFGCFFGDIDAAYQGDEVRCVISYLCT